MLLLKKLLCISLLVFLAGCTPTPKKDMTSEQEPYLSDEVVEQDEGSVVTLWEEESDYKGVLPTVDQLKMRGGNSWTTSDDGLGDNPSGLVNGGFKEGEIYSVKVSQTGYRNGIVIQGKKNLKNVSSALIISVTAADNSSLAFEIPDLVLSTAGYLFTHIVEPDTEFPDFKSFDILTPVDSSFVAKRSLAESTKEKYFPEEIALEDFVEEDTDGLATETVDINETLSAPTDEVSSKKTPLYDGLILESGSVIIKEFKYSKEDSSWTFTISSPEDFRKELSCIEFLGSSEEVLGTFDFNAMDFSAGVETPCQLIAEDMGLAVSVALK